MRATRKSILLIFVLVILSHCKGFYQNDYMFDKELIRLDSNSVIGYKLYQTGIDNYRFEFFVSENSDTTELFETYLNDATYGVAKFEIIRKFDSILIRSNINLGVETTNYKSLIIHLNHYTHAE